MHYKGNYWEPLLLCLGPSDANTFTVQLLITEEVRTTLCESPQIDLISNRSDIGKVTEELPPIVIHAELGKHEISQNTLENYRINVLLSVRKYFDFHLVMFGIQA